jgi:hypothetical protein
MINDFDYSKFIINGKLVVLVDKGGICIFAKNLKEVSLS